MHFPGRLIDRIDYTMAGVLDYDTTVITIGVVLFVGLLLRATVLNRHLFASTVGEKPATITAGGVCLIGSMA